VSVTLDQAWARSERIVPRRIGDDLVLVPLAGRGADIDSIFSLNRVAAFVWDRLDGRTNGEAIVDAIVAQFEVDRERAAADYLELVATLRDVAAIVDARGA
jgi:hypothetical protein